MFKQLWQDDSGFVISIEVVLVGTILGIGVIAGLSSLRDGVVTELADVGGAVAALNQSYNVGGSFAHHSATGASNFVDCHDDCDQIDNADAHNSRCLVICAQTPGECGVTAP